MSEPIDMTGIDPLPSGNFRLRIQVRGHKIAGTYATPEEAAEVRDAARRSLADEEIVPTEGASLAEVTPAFLKSRAGHRNIATDTSLWNGHIVTHPISRKPAASVSRPEILALLDDLKEKLTNNPLRGIKPLSWQTRTHILNLVRSCFGWIMDRGIISAVIANPAVGIRVPREDGDEDEGYQEGWYLDAEEQRMVLGVAREESQELACILKFDMGTGLRKGELCCLHLADVHSVAGRPCACPVKDASPHLIVRYGSWDKKRERYRPPKGKRGERKPRRVDLFGLALEATEEWLALLPTFVRKNPQALMFPNFRGQRRGGFPRAWRRVVERVGVIPHIGRTLWPHLMRHTCASSLLAGWWGQRWSLEDVQKYMGHSTITMTQRYAHLSPKALAESVGRAQAAWQASRHAAVMAVKNTEKSAEILCFPGISGEAIEKASKIAESLRKSPASRERRDKIVTAAVEALRAHADGDPQSVRKLVDALGEALGLLLALSDADLVPAGGAS